MTLYALATDSERRLSDEIRSLVESAEPTVLGVASAFASVFGVRELERVLTGTGAAVRLVAGIDGYITHPNALQVAREIGWAVRLASSHPTGIFHPKLIVGGASFGPQGDVLDPSCFYVGSGNLTYSGFNTNVECGIASEHPTTSSKVAHVFRKYWSASAPLTDATLDIYSQKFGERNRARNTEDLELFAGHDPPMAKEPTPAFLTPFARVTWAGCQSFTGEYTLQIEFPRDAGRVLDQMVERIGRGSQVSIFCADDGELRQANYAYYPQNGMYRLNVPNDVPGVDWVRSHREGALLVSLTSDSDAYLTVRVVRDDSECQAIEKRSQLLGTLGRTSTRAYGWY